LLDTRLIKKRNIKQEEEEAKRSNRRQRGAQQQNMHIDIDFMNYN